MAEHLVFHGCPSRIKDQIRDYWGRKHPRLERLLEHFPDDQRHLRLTVSRRGMTYTAHAVLLLPTATLVGTTQSPRRPLDALDQLTDMLTLELRRHREQLRRDFHRRRRALSPEASSQATARVA